MLFPVLGVILAVFFHWQARNTEIEARKKREKQLQYDYADLVYQLMVFTGAGLTVSRAWKQIVNNYEKRLEHENSQQRAVYEEMEIALGEMENGLPESQAVSRFGERCQHNEYRRLSSILGQSRQTGMKNLQELLGSGDGHCLGTAEAGSEAFRRGSRNEAAPAIISDASGGHGIGDGSGADGDAVSNGRLL